MSVVVAIAALGVTVGWVKLHVIPVTGGHESVTGSPKPPDGVIEMLKEADWPAVTVAAGGAATSAKSLAAIVVVTGADTLPAKPPSSP